MRYRIGMHKNIKNIDLHRVYVCVRRLTVLHHIDMKYITPELVDLIMNQVRNIQCVKNKKTNVLEYIDIRSDIDELKEYYKNQWSIIENACLDFSSTRIRTNNGVESFHSHFIKDEKNMSI